MGVEEAAVELGVEEAAGARQSRPLLPRSLHRVRRRAKLEEAAGARGPPLLPRSLRRECILPRAPSPLARVSRRRERPARDRPVGEAADTARGVKTRPDGAIRARRRAPPRPPPPPPATPKGRFLEPSPRQSNPPTSDANRVGVEPSPSPPVPRPVRRARSRRRSSTDVGRFHTSSRRYSSSTARAPSPSRRGDEPRAARRGDEPRAFREPPSRATPPSVAPPPRDVPRLRGVFR